MLMMAHVSGKGNFGSTHTKSPAKRRRVEVNAAQKHKICAYKRDHPIYYIYFVIKALLG